jgi:hypothetical protein
MNTFRQAPLALLLAVCAAFAQDVTGTIAGVVHDPSNSAVPRTAIRITSTATRAAFQTVAGDEGTYAVRLLPVGEYEVVAKAP